MICNECQHDMSEHRLYGCNAGAEDEAEKARLFDWMAARVARVEITRSSGKVSLCVWLIRPEKDFGQNVFWRTYSAPTLAEAVTKAMEAEGER